ncbi:MAG TPA: sigma-70 family RNA polymerase sigma factor [Bacteroidales bacterium]|nr:sigma-70 family RNA polymerase sigma factor [Bacteroidales bacterium]
MSTQEFNTRLIALEPSLKYFALSLTRNPENAGDLVQDTYLKAIQYRDKYTLDSNIKAWLFTILKNTYLNNVTKLSAKRTISDKSEDDYLIKNTMFDNQNAETQISTKDIDRTIKNLSDDFRLPFQMFVDGYKYKEIADQMELPIGTVKSRIFFARKMLMENLQEYK